MLSPFTLESGIKGKDGLERMDWALDWTLDYTLYLLSY